MASIGRPRRVRRQARLASWPRRRRQKVKGRRCADPVSRLLLPYHTRQGADAPGGTYDYLVNGKMIGGFALLAFPAEYGNSEIMTFMVNQDGTVYQKDLGLNTAEVAREIDLFAPDQSWTKVAPSQSAKFSAHPFKP